MLNISPNNRNHIEEEQYHSFQTVSTEKSSRKLRYALYLIGTALLGIMFLPWTQHIRSGGKLTTLRPEQRPQTINTIIGGRIEKWYVKDGDYVKKGDTILFISEVKDGYFDTLLVDRTMDQIKNKEQSVVSYEQKVNALDTRIDALLQSSNLKMRQARIKYQQSKLKITSDSMEWIAAQTNLKIAQDQVNRFEELKQRGLKSQTELEMRRLTLQRAQASLIGTEQKYLQSRNDLIDALVEVNATEARYQDEIAKAESDKMSALTNMYDAEVDVTKLQSQAAGYSIRNGNYIITSPQDGYVTKILSTGVGQVIKAGQEIATIMPQNYNLAVEMYVRPMDYPLLNKGQKVRMQFDGWPAIVFSGWPNNSFGTYGGTIFAIDNFSSENGMFRVLIAPDRSDHPWPKALRVGGGVNAMILLSDVKVGYEIWRNINGFPPDFYAASTKAPSKKTENKTEHEADEK